MLQPKHFPVADNARSGVLDVLRGFALLGICIANAGYFSMYIFQKPEHIAAFSTAAIDRWLKYFNTALIDGKFYSLFSLLFGIGFAIIFFQKNEGSTKGLLFFYRRIFFLAIFGLAHSFLLWDGDILFFYAITGAVLPLFRKCSNKTLIISSIILLASPLLFDLAKVLTDGKWNISHPFAMAGIYYDNKAGITEDNIPTWVIAHKNYKGILLWNRSGFWWGWQHRMDTNRLPKVLAMFILGLCVGRAKLYERIEQNKTLLKKISIWCLVTGFCSGLGYTYFDDDNISLPAPGGLWDTLFYCLNVAPLSVGYASTAILWYHRSPSKFSWLQPIGRMALTNYIAQSVFGIILYYGIGFGLGGNKGLAFFIPVAILIFLVQVLYSHYWMRYFNYGPLEWLWRQLSYGKRLPIKKHI
ncbi:hypothetical protein DC498_14675 [Terrimonas sp.]|uniref:DUF418 domain-containing protein n=1 Tax=Terrimonas sp. TaxID=1914338 RepID=UPI000D51E351|nr:DUF418 domain-containing protein [Terrimonas sp.]PVD51383.1 hypothetical protein DC498_14675 [Terrimonas sp.]